MATASYQISHLLEKMASTDKDFRFMATNDLMGELQKDNIKLDDDSERKVVKMLLKLLEDKNGEVQNLAVKCLGPLITKVKEFQVELIVDSLCNNMVSDDEQLRDISSIGLKTVISDLPVTQSTLVSNVCKRIVGRLSTAIEKKKDVSVQLEALDILADLLLRYGTMLYTFHSVIMYALLPQLQSERQAVRKRTIVALSYMVLSCSQEHYKELMSHIMEMLGEQPIPIVITYTQCVAAICRQAGQRFGEYIERVMNLILGHIVRDSDDELREYSVQAFEAFVQRCPKEISPYVPQIISLCLKYITYDPNYNYDDGDDDCGMETDELNGEDEEDDDDDEYSDDDDITWKVRRSAAKCLEAIIEARRDLICDMYKTVSPQLIARFKEREENVKSDIFHTYVTLLRQTKSYPTNSDSDHMDVDTPLSLLQSQVALIVKSIHVQLRERSIKTRQDSLILLKELISVLPGCLADYMSILIPGIQYSLGKEKYTSSNMKIDALSFLNCVLSSHPAEAFHPHVGVIVPLVVTAVGDNFYKIIAEALIVLQQLVQVIRPLDHPSTFDFTVHTNSIYECTLKRLKTTDIDQEVKEHAISCMGQIICNLGDYLQDEVVVCLPIFLDRLKNEITRLTTVKALTKIAGSPLHVNLTPIMGEGIPIVASFLRKNHRALKLYTLILLDGLVSNYNDVLDIQMLRMILKEIPPLISDSDLHIAQLSLTLLSSIARTQPESIAEIPLLLEQILILAKSPLLQGGALSAMLNFFNTLVAADLPGLKYKDLLAMVTSSISKDLHKQAYHSLAKCVASICSTKPNHALLLVEKYTQEIKYRRSDDQAIFPLFAIGEIGKFIDLGNLPILKDVIIQSFSTNSEEVKSAASYALGCMAIGNLEHYLPFILNQVEILPRRQYLLLHSLKDIICFQSSSPAGISQLLPYIEDIWKQLYKHCECPEEGTRNVVAECLGKLTLINPSVLLPELQNSLLSKSTLMRTTALTAVKFTISDQPQAIDSLLKQTMGTFVTLLQDEDYNVRRVALITFNSAAHNKPSLIRDRLDSILPELYAETNIKKNLIREVEMGPFKHTVDDGLDIRKAAFECMYTLLDACLDRLDIFQFLNYLEQGLKDHYDIKMLTYLMVMRLSQLAPTAVLQRMDRLIEPLKATCMMKVKANSVKQEFEKQDELKRSAIRAISSLVSIPDSDKNPALNEFLSLLKVQSDLSAMWESVRKDSTGFNQDQNSMDVS